MDASELGSTEGSEGGGELARDFLQDSTELSLEGGREGWYAAKQGSWWHVLLACGDSGRQRPEHRGSCCVQSGSQVKLWESVRQGRGHRVIRTAGSRLGKGMGGGAKATVFEVITATVAMRIERGEIHNILGSQNQ